MRSSCLKKRYPARHMGSPGDEKRIFPSKNKHTHLHSSTYPEPMPKIPSFRRGYAGRRASETGPARVGRVETQNLIIRVRGKWFPSGDTGRNDGTRIDPSFLDARKERAGRACAAHRVAEPDGCVGCHVRPIIGEPTVNNRPVRPRQRSRSRGQKPPNGALRGVTYKLSYEAAFSALSDIRMADMRMADSLERPGVL